MARRFHLIVFDWDGTLMDSAGVIVTSIQRAAQDLGLEPPPEAACRHIIGLGLTEALAQLFPALPEAEHPRLVTRYRYHYLGRDAQIPLFAGVDALVRELHAQDYLLGVATGKSRKGLDRVLGYTGLGAYFHATRCADECFSKPHPQMLEELMGQLGVRPERTLMIGDTSHDLQMAANAGVPALAVSYGAHRREDLLAHGPLACVNSVEELRTWLMTCA
ncbi:HAD-IA family hydrolase [Thiobacter aerophilum]|uniref:HAD-IA family hydrolase n=1 Tax=Thiobacter aerophilum TaxID=3121275 RepID=A0ABV0ECZ0_9BURK